jgi:hypothetical protein
MYEEAFREDVPESRKAKESGPLPGMDKRVNDYEPLTLHDFV